MQHNIAIPSFRNDLSLGKGNVKTMIIEIQSQNKQKKFRVPNEFKFFWTAKDNLC